MSPHRIFGSLAILFCIALSAHPSKAQDEVPAAVTDQNRSGDLPFSGVIGSSTERVIINSGNLVVNIPIIHVKGRDGLDFDFGLRYDGRNLVIAQRPSSIWTFEAHNYVPSNGVWQTNQPTLSYISYSRKACVGVGGSGTAQGTKAYILQDAQGAKHTISAGYETAECPAGQWTYHNSGPDNTNAGFWGNLSTVRAPTLTIMDANGTVYGGGNGNTITTPPGEIMGTFGSYSNTNGNVTNNSPAGNDTLGRPIVTQTNGTNQVTYTVHASDGSTQNYVANYSSISIHTAFGFAQEFVGTRPALSSVVLPNGRSYSFVYDVYGSLTSLTLPTGAVITYTWTNTAPGLAQYRYVTSRTVTVNGVSSQWTFSQTSAAPGCPSGFAGCTEVTVTDPLGNQSTYYGLAGGTLQANIYQGTATGTPLRQYNVSYSTYGDGSMLPAAVTTQLDNGLVSKITYTYDSLSYTFSNCLSGDLNCEQFGPTVSQNSTSRGNVLETDTYGWGQGSPGPLIRKNIKTYLHDSNSAYVAPNIVDKVLTDTTYDGAGNQVAQTQYEYDNYVAGDNPLAAAANAAEHDDTGHGASFTLRGNATRVKRWRNTDGALLTSTYTYDILGNIRAIKDPLTHTTSYDYTDSLANTSCPPMAGKTGQAWVSTVTNPLGQLAKVVTYPCSGLVQNHKDQNEITAGFSGTSYTYDFFGRTTQKSVSDGGQTATTYNDVPPLSQSSSMKINSATNLTSTTLMDGLGRTTQTQLTSDPQGTVFTDTTYDLLSRVASVSNPHRSTGSSTDGITTYAYDPLGRTARVTLQDGSFTTTTYFGNITTVTDPAGKSRKSVTDALGRLTQVFEDPSGLNFETDYSYDALNNLLSVVQVGSRQRSFVYNSLSQLTQATNPESGTINYTYDADGNLLTKQDARSITTTYSYDTLNRLTQKSYSDGTTPSAFFAYDGPTNGFGVPVTNVVGRLTEEWTGTSCCASVAGEIFGYDPLGRIILNEQYTPSTSYIPVNYTYDLVGDLLTATNGEGVTISYSYDSADRPTAVTSSLVDSQHPATLATVDPSVGYYPTGAIRKMTYGNGLTQAVSLQPRLQPCRINLNSSGAYVTDGCSDGTISGTIQDFDYAYGTWGTTNNGNVTVMDAVGIQNFGRSYTYDSINRIATMSAPGDSCSGLSWTFDSWGNRTSQTATGGSCYQQPSTTFSAKNQLPPPYQYDAAGNMTYDGTHTYTYDAENRLTQVDGGATATYVYDANGNRVQKTAGGTQIDYVYDLSGNVIAEINSSGWLKGYAYLAGQTVAEYFDGTTYFVHSDHLGSTRLLTGLNQAVVQNLDYLPYGELTSTNSGIDTHKFTGKERDTESGNDYFGARYYASSMGRFLSPDWSAKVEPVPYSKLDNPQTLNLYAYVGNNPLSRVDPTGHADIAAECKGQSTCNKTLVQTVNIVHQAKGKTVVDSTLSVTTKFSLTTDAKGNVSASASSTVANVSGLKFSDSQLATMGKDIGTMQQAAVGMGFGQNTTELVTAVGAAESHFGASPSYAGAPNYMNPAINPMQLTGGNGANTDLNHNVEGGMGILDWAGRPSTFDPTATYTRYSDHSPTTMSNWNAIYGSINETQP